MIENVYYYVSDSSNPYHNAALCSHIFNNIPDDSLVFVLYQNQDTVSIPTNGTPYNHVNFNEIENDRCYLERRQTMGKILFNDLGTINYAFFLYLNNYDVLSQTNVIYQALRKLNIPVYLNDENEMMIERKKISDQRYMTKEEHCMHSGSLYWDLDKAKRASMIIDDISKRDYANITDFYPCTNLLDVKKRILQSLADCYGTVKEYSLQCDLSDLVNTYHSSDYIYQSDKKYTLIINDQYEFGPAQIYVDMIKNKVIRVDVYLSNGNDDIADEIRALFENIIIDNAVFKKEIDKINSSYRDDYYKIYSRIRKQGYRV